MPTSPAKPNRASTNSRCAIISTRSAATAAGTAKPRRRHCRPASWTPPASVIWRPIAVSPGTIWRLEVLVDDTDGQGDDDSRSGYHHRIFSSVHPRTSGTAWRRSHVSAGSGDLARTLPARLRTADPAARKDCRPLVVGRPARRLFDLDRKSTRLNSSHSQISYAVFCLKKKKKNKK